MKKIIKIFLTFIFNPITFIKLVFTGNKGFIIGKRCKINSTKGITLNKNFRMGTDLRILMIKKYWGNNYNPKLQFGDNTFVGNRCTFLISDKLQIGDNCLIASDVLFTTESHGIDPITYESYSHQPLISKPISIGDGCWIAEKVSILPGVTLGKKCIVATGAVVTKSFDDYSMIAGVPAKLIKVYDINEKKWKKV